MGFQWIPYCRLLFESEWDVSHNFNSLIILEKGTMNSVIKHVQIYSKNLISDAFNDLSIFTNNRTNIDER